MQHRSLIAVTVLLIGLAATMALAPPHFGPSPVSGPDGTVGTDAPAPRPQPGPKDQIVWINSAPEVAIADIAANPAAYDKKQVILSTTAYYYEKEAYLADTAGSKIAFAGFPDSQTRQSSDALNYFKGLQNPVGEAQVYAFGTMLTSGGPYTTGVASTSFAIVLEDLRLR